MSLKKFIASRNKTIDMWASMGQNIGTRWPENPRDLTAEQKAALGQELSTALSPESLTCDGELRGAKLVAKSNMLNAAKKELEALGVAVPVY